MMRAIWKFDLAVTDYQQVIMTVGAHPLSVAFQGSQLRMWAEVEPDRRLSESLPVWIVGTGNPLPDMGSAGAGFLGTAHDPRGFVWHVYVGGLR